MPFPSVGTERNLPSKRVVRIVEETGKDCERSGQRIDKKEVKFQCYNLNRASIFKIV